MYYRHLISSATLPSLDSSSLKLFLLSPAYHSLPTFYCTSLFGRFDLNIAIAGHDCLEVFFAWIFKVVVSDGILDIVLNGTAEWTRPHFGSYPKSTNFSLTLSVTSKWILLLERRLLTSASMSSTIWRRLSLLRGLNSMMPSKRFINSGLKKLPSSPRTELVRPSRAAQNQR